MRGTLLVFPRRHRLSHYLPKSTMTHFRPVHQKTRKGRPNRVSLLERESTYSCLTFTGKKTKRPKEKPIWLDKECRIAQQVPPSCLASAKVDRDASTHVGPASGFLLNPEGSPGPLYSQMLSSGCSRPLLRSVKLGLHRTFRKQFLESSDDTNV